MAINYPHKETVQLAATAKVLANLCLNQPIDNITIKRIHGQEKYAHGHYSGLDAARHSPGDSKFKYEIKFEKRKKGEAPKTYSGYRAITIRPEIDLIHGLVKALESESLFVIFEAGDEKTPDRIFYKKNSF
jgi:hypothetical protein